MNAVEFDHVSKRYAIYDSPADRLKEFATFNRRGFHRDFEALRDVTFEIRRGEVFCIIGENGSGKSTSLQLMAGILQPSAGEVRVNGRVAALLELGAGFNPEFTGRENARLYCSILGLTARQIAERAGSIEAFAEIGAFIDHPVRTYSSGMLVRLAFACAIHTDPEILIVDGDRLSIQTGGQPAKVFALSDDPAIAGLVDSVRAALVLVSRGEVPVGIVYRTDAAVDPGVEVAAAFPPDSYPPITYPAALVASSKNAVAAAFLDYMKSPDGMAVWKEFGFVPALKAP